MSTMNLFDNKNKGADISYGAIRFSDPKYSLQDEKIIELPIQKKSIFGNYFRYVICMVFIISCIVCIYSVGVLSTAAIEMVSGDVINNRLTQIRAKHIALDPLASSRNAASPGTCPVVASPNQDIVHMMLNQNSTNWINFTQISLNEHLQLAKDIELIQQEVAAGVDDGRYVEWTIDQRAWILSAHSYGAAIFVLPMCQLGLRYGNKLVVAICILVSAIRALMFPLVVAHGSFWLVLTWELTVGALGSNLVMLLYPLSADWLLPSEANILIGSISLTPLIGDTMSTFLTAHILANGISWKWAFIVPGSILFVMGILWCILFSDEPEMSNIISTEELVILQNSLAKRRKLKELEQNGKLSEQVNGCRCTDVTCSARTFKRVANWRTILGCPTIWSIILVNFFSHWNMKIPAIWAIYFKNILHWETHFIGSLLGLRGILGLIVGATVAYTTRNFTVRRPFNMSLTTYRKSGASLSIAILTLSVGSMVIFDCSDVANIIGVMLTLLIPCLNSISIMQMILDLSAQDSGLIAGYIKMVSCGELAALPVSSYVLSFGLDPVIGDRVTWQIVWLLGWSAKLFSVMVFLWVAKANTGRNYSQLKPNGRCLLSQ